MVPIHSHPFPASLHQQVLDPSNFIQQPRSTRPPEPKAVAEPIPKCPAGGVQSRPTRGLVTHPTGRLQGSGNPGTRKDSWELGTVHPTIGLMIHQVLTNPHIFSRVWRNQVHGSGDFSPDALLKTVKATMKFIGCFVPDEPAAVVPSD